MLARGPPLRDPPAAGASPLQLAGLSDQAALAADDPQLVLVGRGQVDGAGGNGGSQVAGAGDVQVGQNLSTGQRRGVGSDRNLSCPPEFFLDVSHLREAWPWTSMTSRELK